MSFKVQVSGRDGSHEEVLDQLPDRCPRCHRSMQPLPYIQNEVPLAGDGKSIRLVFCCPALTCRRLFLAVYEENEQRKNRLASDPTFLFQTCEPQTPPPVAFSTHIRQVSPSFVEIYEQSTVAEAAGLHHVCGPGYRKALEFLIKDYLIGELKQPTDHIAKATLGGCIKELVGNPKIKACAERAAWLGNDETHYSRKWEDRDVKDLKMLIALTVHWIESEMLVGEYATAMPS